jgi:ATP-dependent RNA helicase DDX54/DBP10
VTKKQGGSSLTASSKGSHQKVQNSYFNKNQKKQTRKNGHDRKLGNDNIEEEDGVDKDEQSDFEIVPEEPSEGGSDSDNDGKEGNDGDEAVSDYEEEDHDGEELMMISKSVKTANKKHKKSGGFQSMGKFGVFSKHFVVVNYCCRLVIPNLHCNHS